jgi:lysine 2,3-aminomutase
MLKNHHPIFINTHFNHPWEITDESSKACRMLVDAGIPVNNQAVLMKDINDNPEVMKELFLKLLTIRVRPYYLFMTDETKSTNHFRTTIDRGIEIIDKLRGHISGLAIPHFVIDAPGGGGKIPLLPKYVLHQDEDKIVLRNYKHEVYVYRDVKNGEKNSGKVEISKDVNILLKEPKLFKSKKEPKPEAIFTE